MPRGEISIARLAALARERWGMEAFVLHDGGLHAGASEIVVLLEARSNDASPSPSDGSLFPRLPRSRPWQRPGWHAGAVAWLDGCLRGRGAALTGEVTQISTNDLACVLEARSSEGSVYLKAAEGAAEAAALTALAPMLPDCIPELLGAREDGLFATRHAGEHLSRSGDLALWREALEKLARFHREVDPARFDASGAPTLDLAALRSRANELFHDRPGLEGWGLGPEAVERLAALAPTVDAAHARLGALGLRDAFTHGDAHPMNALAGPGGVVWFDWAEAGTAHPLLDAGWFFAWLSHPSRSGLPIRRAEPDAPGILWTHYLQALGAPEAAERLGDAIVVALAHRAVRFAGRYRDWRGTVPGWRPQYAPYYLNWLGRLGLEAADAVG